MIFDDFPKNASLEDVLFLLDPRLIKRTSSTA